MCGLSACQIPRSGVRGGTQQTAAVDATWLPRDGIQVAVECV
jgi:hypothetical protein